MFSLEKEAKKAALVDILYLDNLIDTQVREESLLARLSSHERPAVFDDQFPWALIGVWSLGLFALGVLYGLQQNLFLIQFAGAVCATVVTFLLLLQYSSRRAQLAKTEILLKGAFTELKKQRSFLSRHLTDLDRRTSQYFHCVTTSKVTAYYLLSQTLHELNATVDTLERLLARNDVLSLQEVYDILSGSVTISDGLVVCSGREHAVPLPRIGLTVEKLIESLEEGLSELEVEISHFRSYGAVS